MDKILPRDGRWYALKKKGANRGVKVDKKKGNNKLLILLMLCQNFGSIHLVGLQLIDETMKKHKNHVDDA